MAPRPGLDPEAPRPGLTSDDRFTIQRDRLNFDRQLCNRFEPIDVDCGIFSRLFASSRYDSHKDNGNVGVHPKVRLELLIDVIQTELRRAVESAAQVVNTDGVSVLWQCPAGVQAVDPYVVLPEGDGMGTGAAPTSAPAQAANAAPVQGGWFGSGIWFGSTVVAGSTAGGSSAAAGSSAGSSAAAGGPATASGSAISSGSTAASGSAVASTPVERRVMADHHGFCQEGGLTQISVCALA
jgi:hypothetical protein